MSQSLPLSRVLLLTAINICNYLDRYLINAILPILLVEFSLNDFQGGQLVSAFVIGYVIFSPIFGYLGDRLSRPLLMMIGILCWGAATLGSSVAVGLASLVIARICVGVGEASYGTIAPGYMKDHEPDPIRLNKMLSIFFAAIPVGSALGFVAGGLIAQHFSWHMVFVLGAIPALLLAPFVMRLPEIERKRPPSSNIIAGVREILGVRILWFAIGGYILNTFALTGIAAFVAKLGVQLGFGLAEINNYFGIILVCAGFVGTLVGGRCASWFASRHRVPSLGMLQFVALVSLIAVPVLALTFVVQDRALFLVLCGITELLIFAGIAPINSIIVLESPPSLVTLTQGMTILMINLFGALVGPQVVGFISDATDLATGMQITSVAMFLCASIWWAGTRTPRTNLGTI